MVKFIMQSDLLSKIIAIKSLTPLVIVALISITKIMLIKLRSNQIKKISKLLENTDDIQDLKIKTMSLKNNFIANLINSYLADFQDFLNLYLMDSGFNNDFSNNNNDKYFQMLQSRLAQKLDCTLIKQMTSISVLSTLAQCAPILGILGTTWKIFYILQSPGNIVGQQLKISPVAFASCLSPMFAGLIISLSSLVLFNYLHKKFILFEQDLTELTNKFYWKIRLMQYNKLNTLNSSPFLNNSKYQQNVL